MNRDIRPEEYAEEEEYSSAASPEASSPPQTQRSPAEIKKSLYEVDELLQNIMYDAGCDENDIRRTGLSRNPNSPSPSSPGIVHVHVEQPTPQGGIDRPEFRLTIDGRILRQGDPGFNDPPEHACSPPASAAAQNVYFASTPPAAAQNVYTASTPPAPQTVRNMYDEGNISGVGNAPQSNAPQGMMSPMSPADPFDLALSKALSHAAMATAELRNAVERCNGRHGSNSLAVSEIQGEINAAAELLARLK